MAQLSRGLPSRAGRRPSQCQCASVPRHPALARRRPRRPRTVVLRRRTRQPAPEVLDGPVLDRVHEVTERVVLFRLAGEALRVHLQAAVIIGPEERLANIPATRMNDQARLTIVAQSAQGLPHRLEPEREVLLSATDLDALAAKDLEACRLVRLYTRVAARVAKIIEVRVATESTAAVLKNLVREAIGAHAGGDEFVEDEPLAVRQNLGERTGRRISVPTRLPTAAHIEGVVRDVEAVYEAVVWHAAEVAFEQLGAGGDLFESHAPTPTPLDDAPIRQRLLATTRALPCHCRIPSGLLRQILHVTRHPG